MHEEYASYKAESLAVANLIINQGVGLEQVKERQLAPA